MKRKRYTEPQIVFALLKTEGSIHVGVSISPACGIGLCAEHSAVAQMLTQQKKN